MVDVVVVGLFVLFRKTSRDLAPIVQRPIGLNGLIGLRGLMSPEVFLGGVRPWTAVNVVL